MNFHFKSLCKVFAPHSHHIFIFFCKSLVLSSQLILELCNNHNNNNLWLFLIITKTFLSRIFQLIIIFSIYTIECEHSLQKSKALFYISLFINAAFYLVSLFFLLFLFPSFSFLFLFLFPLIFLSSLYKTDISPSYQLHNTSLYFCN